MATSPSFRAGRRRVDFSLTVQSWVQSAQPAAMTAWRQAPVDGLVFLGPLTSPAGRALLLSNVLSGEHVTINDHTDWYLEFDDGETFLFTPDNRDNSPSRA